MEDDWRWTYRISEEYEVFKVYLGWKKGNSDLRQNIKWKREGLVNSVYKVVVKV